MTLEDFLDEEFDEFVSVQSYCSSESLRFDVYVDINVDRNEEHFRYAVYELDQSDVDGYCWAYKNDAEVIVDRDVFIGEAVQISTFYDSYYKRENTSFGELLIDYFYTLEGLFESISYDLQCFLKSVLEKSFWDLEDDQGLKLNFRFECDEGYEHVFESAINILIYRDDAKSIQLNHNYLKKQK